ncbi:protein SHI RELATED SEQUENCE 1 isoform X2 [Helianthus annuus]|uniref:protein SHI RELATED SEQUENCE 1 isoform X2 n=1 Tax=Helianthus annuus TaxID=4232 RepID=UPI001653201E|nr:protein SHI RELATED SEQUENCE 1 isoform X2 [Helianthus annuus]
MRQAGYAFGGDYFGDGGGRDGNGGVSCQDCGNQAKKDCQHMRCRTCCRSRGFPCETHVKSTWVPAAKRRERHQQLSLSTQEQNSSNQQLSLMIASGGDGGGEHNLKRFREERQHHHHVRGGVAVPTTNLQNTASGFPFPAEVSSPAMFRRVRVSGMDETNEQMAYQTAISVGGHVFNGILYDHGPDQGQYSHPVGESSSTTGNQHQDVNLITSGTTTTSSNSIYQAVTIIDPSSVYPTPLCAFIPGTQFFPPPRS